ncbi:hypothetical protein [Gillisia mitskevichiae]|uniref:hypothetical protein n=1 Tax=Gillisia mitskevichiae TaxID=270921 RepID=UPI0015FF5695|nr:hypothetical protein [Gillisia mitskevichiae]
MEELCVQKYHYSGADIYFKNGVTGINIGTGDHIYIYIEYNGSNKITCKEQRYY